MAVTDRKRQQLLQDLAPALGEGEQVLEVSTGLVSVKRLGSSTDRRGTFFITDRRVGIFTKKLGGHDMLDFAYGLLTSVQYQRGMRFGEITLLASGDSKEFHMIPKDMVDGMVQIIRERMALARHPVGDNPTTPAASVADELMKLAQLRDSGLLSEDEFAAQKAKLLG